MLSNWAILIVFLGAFVYVGYRAGKRTTSEGDFLLAGRSMGPLSIAATFFATYYSGWAFMGDPGVAYQYGTISMLQGALYAAAVVTVILFLAGFVRKRAAQLGNYTVTEYASKLHNNNKLIWFIGSLATLCLMIVFMTAQMKAIGLLLGPYLGLSFQATVILLGVIMTVYTANGGLKAVVWTEIIQAIAMTFGALVCLLVALKVVGGFGGLFEMMNKVDPKLLNPDTALPFTPNKYAVSSAYLFALLGMVSAPYMVVRLMAARADIAWWRTALYILPMCACAIFGARITGMVVRVVYPTALAAPDQAMPTFLGNYVPGWLVPIITVCIFMAMLSTVQSILHNLASVISYDFRKIFWGSSESLEKKGLKINRWATVFVGAVVILVSLVPQPGFLVFMGILGTGTLQATMVGPVFISTVNRQIKTGIVSKLFWIKLNLFSQIRTA